MGERSSSRPALRVVTAASGVLPLSRDPAGASRDHAVVRLARVLRGPAERRAGLRDRGTLGYSRVLKRHARGTLGGTLWCLRGTWGCSRAQKGTPAALREVQKGTKGYKRVQRGTPGYSRVLQRDGAWRAPGYSRNASRLLEGVLKGYASGTQGVLKGYSRGTHAALKRYSVAGRGRPAVALAATACTRRGRACAPTRARTAAQSDETNKQPNNKHTNTQTRSEKRRRRGPPTAIIGTDNRDKRYGYSR